MWTTFEKVLRGAWFGVEAHNYMITGTMFEKVSHVNGKNVETEEKQAFKPSDSVFVESENDLKLN